MSFIDIVWKIIYIMSTAIVFVTVFMQFVSSDSWFQLKRFYNKLETIRLWQNCRIDNEWEEDLFITVKGKSIRVFINENSDASSGYYFVEYTCIYIHINDEPVCRLHRLSDVSMLFAKYALSYKCNYDPDEIDLIVEEAYKQAKTEMSAYYDKKHETDHKSFF